MRLFVAIDLPEAIRAGIARWMTRLRPASPGLRWVDPDGIHLTLKFIGEVTEQRMGKIRGALGEVKGIQSVEIKVTGAGFFPNDRHARVFWIGVQPGLNFSTLAGGVDAALTPFTTTRERAPYIPHLTLARAGSGRPQRGPGDAPSPRFQKLQEKLAGAPEPDFGTMTAREFFLYESKLSPGGAEYRKIERFALS